MAISPYLAELRAVVGNRLLLVPTVAVLPRDAEGRILLVRVSDSGLWATVGGAIEPDETPEEAAVREAAEEAGVTVRLRSLVTVVGGPGYRLTYPSGDRAAFVSAVYDAEITAGEPVPDHDETCEVGWFTVDELAGLDLNEVNQRLLEDVVPLLAPVP